MTRLVTQYLQLEVAALGLFETFESFLIIEAFLSLPDAPVGATALSPAQAIQLAPLVAPFVVITAVSALTIGLYRPDVCKDWRRLVVSAGLASILAFSVLLLATPGLHLVVNSDLALSLALLLLAWQLGVIITHSTFHALMRPNAMLRRVLIVGTDQRAMRFADMLSTSRALFEPVVHTGDVRLWREEICQQHIWAVVVSDAGQAGPALDILLDSKLRGTRILTVAAFCDQYLQRIDLEAADTNWLLGADGFAHGAAADAIKRLLDLAVSLTLLLLTSPIIAVTALLIKLDSRGPVLYLQQRVGLHGRPFTLLKFRSMRTDAEAVGSPCWAQQGDPRVTRVGRFIRPMRIDELPQLLNVLAGAMSMVGPRPERPHFVEQLNRIIPQYCFRTYVKPGITGWAQVSFPYGASFEDAREKLAYDLFYVKNRSIIVDVMILLMTVPVILFREGGR